MADPPKHIAGSPVPHCRMIRIFAAICARREPKHDAEMDSMRKRRRRFLQLAAAVAVLAAAPHPASSQAAYPTRPVRFIVGQAAGSSSDITARLIAQWLSERLHQQFVVEARPGAGGNIATEAVV